MKNHLILGGVVAAAVLTGVGAARVSGDSSIHRNTTVVSSDLAAERARQQMARMIAETAARSAAQAAKAVIAESAVDFTRIGRNAEDLGANVTASVDQASSRTAR